MERSERYAEWLLANKDKQGTPEFETVAGAYKALRSGAQASETTPPISTEAKQPSLSDYFSGGLESTMQSLGTAFKAPFLSPEELEQRVKEQQATQKAPAGDLEKVKKIAAEQGYLAAGKEALSQVPGVIAEQLPMLGTTASGALAGGTIGSVVPGVGTGLGAVLGAGAALAAQSAGANIERQITEQIKAGEKVDPNLLAAYGTAAVQAGIDVIGGPEAFFIKQFGKEAGTQLAKQFAEEGIGSTIAKGIAKTAATEIPTEVAQQALERGQAGLPLTGEEAGKEYEQAAYIAGLAAPIGAPIRMYEKSQAQTEAESTQEETRSFEEPVQEVPTLTQHDIGLKSTTGVYKRIKDLDPTDPADAQRIIDELQNPRAAMGDKDKTEAFLGQLEQTIRQPERPINEPETTPEITQYDTGATEAGNAPEVGISETPIAVPSEEKVAPAEDIIPETSPEVLSEQPDAVKDFVGRETQYTAAKAKRNVIRDAVDWVKGFDADAVAQSLVRPEAPVSSALKEAGTFSDGKHRGDIIMRTKGQIGNVIQAAAESGPVIPAGDGTLKASVNPRLAPLQIFQKVIDLGKKHGFDGTKELAEAYRISWGEETLAADTKLRAEAEKLKAEAKDYKDLAERMAKEGTHKADDIAAVNKRAQTLAKKAADKEDVYRERTVTAEDIKKKDAFLKAVPEMKQYMQDIRDLIKSNVDLWYQTGRIDKSTKDEWNSKAYYMPMQVFSEAKSMFDDVPEHWGVGAGARSVAGIEKRKGHSEAVNFWDNIQKQQAFMTAIAAQNLARNEALTQMQKYGAAKLADDQSDSGKKGNYVVSYVDGKKTWWEVKNPELVKSFQNFNYQLNPLMKIAHTGAKVLRTTALVQPYYWYKQLVIDPIHASFVGGVGNVTPLHSFYEFAKIISGSSKVSPILRRHGVIGGVDVIHDMDSIRDQIGYAMQLKAISPSKLVHTIEKIHEAADAATRVAVYKKALKLAEEQGLKGNDAENFAVGKARELINFSVHGTSSSVNTMRHMVPFFSAALNSLDTTYRAMTGHNLNAKEAAKARADFRNAAALTFTLTSIYALLMLQDQDYLDTKGIDKDGNWLLPLPDDENGRHGFLKIPTPHELGFLFKTIPELGIRYMANDATTREVLKSIGEGVIRNTPPLTPLAQIVKPSMDVSRNYNAITGAPIESIGQQRLPIERRGEANASELSKWISADLGAKNINLSPAKVDYLIRGYFAEWGAMGSALADSMIRSIKGEDKTPTKDWINSKENPMRSLFTSPISTRNKEELYELFQSSQQIVNSVNDYNKQGKGEKARELLADEETRKQFAGAPALQTFIQNEARFRDQIKVLSNRPDTPENRARIKEIQRKSNENASRAIQVAKRLEIPH